MRRICVLAALGGFLLSSAHSFGDEAAAEGPPGPVAPPERRGPPEFYELELTTVWIPDSDTEGVGGDGEFSENRYSAGVGWSRFVALNNISRIEATFAHRDYDITGDNLYSGSFDRVNALNLQTTFERPFTDRWSVFSWAGVSFQAAEGADLLDGWNVPFALGAGYLFSEQLVVSAGVLGILEAEADGFVIPIVSLRWRPNDRFSLLTLNGVRATYKMGGRKQWTLVGTALYQTFVFAVEDLEGFRETRGVISQEYWLGRVGLERSFGRQFEVGAYVEGRFNRKFEYIRDEDEFAGFDVDPGAGLRFSGTYRF